MKIKVNQSTYFVQQTGAGAPFWVLLHGFMGSHQDFAKLQPILSGTVLSIDLLGHGQTQSPETKSFSMTQQIQDLQLLLTKIIGTQSIHLIGYSMGGRIALGFSVTHPRSVTRLYLESSRPGLQTLEARTQRKQHDQQLAARMLQVGLPQFVADWAALPLFSSQKQLPIEIQQNVQRQRLHQDPLALAKSLQDMGTGQQPNYWPQLSQLTMPVTLITGALDQKFTTLNQKILEKLPQGKHFICPEAGHNVHLEAPFTFLRYLTCI